LRRRAIAALLVVLSVAMLTLYFSTSGGGLVHRAQETGLRIVAPLQSGSARAVKPFRDAWNWVGDLFHAKSENANLRKQVDQLRTGAAESLSIADQNTQLRDLLHMSGEAIYPKDMRLVTSRVIARSTVAWYSTVTIDVGTDQGVQVYDAVVNGQGLVGRVSAVTGNSAQVTLLTDQQSYVDAMVVPGRADGVLAGSVTGDLTLQYVDKNQAVKVGQYVVTSGMKSSIFVRGIPIGVVENVGNQDVELYQNIAVRPLVDFHRLDLVMVVLK
jgi:rod shape-determining protein MreC